MPRDQEAGGGPRVSSEEGWVEGNEAHTLAEAVSRAVDDANQPPGTILKVDVYVRSVGDPDVGAYKVIATPI